MVVVYELRGRDADHCCIVVVAAILIVVYALGPLVVLVCGAGATDHEVVMRGLTWEKLGDHEGVRVDDHAVDSHRGRVNNVEAASTAALATATATIGVEIVILVGHVRCQLILKHVIVAMVTISRHPTKRLIDNR